MFIYIEFYDKVDPKLKESIIAFVSYDAYKAGAHFTNNFSITIQMWWKFHFALIQILI